MPLAHLSPLFVRSTLEAAISIHSQRQGSSPTLSLPTTGQWPRAAMAGVVASHHRPIGAFNPAWCLRPQTGCRDGAVGRWEDGPLTSVSASPFSLSSLRTKGTHAARGSGAAAADPLSPKVSCMGQVKRDKAAAGGRGSPLVMAGLLKLRRKFAGRSSVLPGVAAVAASPPRGAARGKAGAGCRGPPPGIRVAELDPPLPVVKREAGEAGQVSLWRRRSCGGEMVLVDLHLRPQRDPPPPLCVYQLAVVA